MVVRGLEDLPDESVDGLLGYAAAPADDVALVLVHGGGQKGSGRARPSCASCRPVTEVEVEASCEPSEFPGFVTAEVRRHGATHRPGGRDVPGPGRRPGPALARGRGRPADQRLPRRGARRSSRCKQYFGGRAEAKSFAVADAAFSGRRRVALEELRWALDGGTAAGAGHLRVRRQRPRAGALQVGAARACARPTSPARSAYRRGSCARPRPVARLVRRAASPGRSGPSPRPTPTSRARPSDAAVHPRAAGPHHHRPARPADLGLRPPAQTRQTRPDQGRVGEAASVRARRPSWRWPTCGWRPGSCG